ncbi:helix-turn-helix transcriptional regulator [Hymenobacter sp. BT664]|uniref:Helix-turn-helix transcriptional regulator n=1 Tax=Hymenobacter montanus TaxID=2771359 RepID=A0A927BF73_9BACT|nr:helix-turn-helix domain-containing protein [Hymenobacter montanus]MBD2769054.1 helix-turn-helix transcriptional regulator [Hymenobacter montanus]
MTTKKKYPHCCPVRYTLDLIGGKWKLPIVALLRSGALRFTEIERALPGISARMLIKELKELESHGLLTRTVFAAVPLRVEYCLTDDGYSLCPVFQAMHAWGSTHMASFAEETAACIGPKTVGLAEPTEAQKLG